MVDPLAHRIGRLAPLLVLALALRPADAAPRRLAMHKVEQGPVPAAVMRLSTLIRERSLELHGELLRLQEARLLEPVTRAFNKQGRTRDLWREVAEVLTLTPDQAFALHGPPPVAVSEAPGVTYRMLQLAPTGQSHQSQAGTGTLTLHAGVGFEKQVQERVHREQDMFSFDYQGADAPQVRFVQFLSCDFYGEGGGERFSAEALNVPTDDCSNVLGHTALLRSAPGEDPAHALVVDSVSPYSPFYGAALRGEGYAQMFDSPDPTASFFNRAINHEARATRITEVFRFDTFAVKGRQVLGCDSVEVLFTAEREDEFSHSEIRHTSRRAAAPVDCSGGKLPDAHRRALERLFPHFSYFPR